MKKKNNVSTGWQLNKKVCRYKNRVASPDSIGVETYLLVNHNVSGINGASQLQNITQLEEIRPQRQVITSNEFSGLKGNHQKNFDAFDICKSHR